MEKDDFLENHKDKTSEIAGVLKGQKVKLDGIETNANDLEQSRSEVSSKLDGLIKQAEGLCEDVGIDMPERRPVLHLIKTDEIVPVTYELTWDTLVNEYKEEDSLFFDTSLDELLPPEIIQQIENDFNAPLNREPWIKWGDYIAVVVAGLSGAVFDLLLNHGVLFNEDIHKSINHKRHPVDFPIGGGSAHRTIGAGHDLLRFGEARQMLINGKFEAVFRGKKIFSDTYKYAGEIHKYSNIPEGQATNVLLMHWFADFFSKRSLPVPGLSYLVEQPGRIADFAIEAYENGFNFRSLLSNISGVLLTKLILTIYLMISRYANKVPRWYALSGETKHHEMFIVAHATNLAVNVGKIVVTQNVFALNVPAVMAVIRHLIPVIGDYRRRRSPKVICERNRTILDDNWGVLEKYVIEEIKNEVAIKDFLSGEPIKV